MLHWHTILCSVLTHRKIEIVKFARSTRQSFVRLLALVKWASSAAKVDKCAVSCTTNLCSIYVANSTLILKSNINITNLPKCWCNDAFSPDTNNNFSVWYFGNIYLQNTWRHVPLFPLRIKSTVYTIIWLTWSSLSLLHVGYKERHSQYFEVLGICHYTSYCMDLRRGRLQRRWRIE